MASEPALFTAVIGAGPAGLLFCFVSRLLESESARWTIALFDKRDSYERTHRLRMDPEPYRAIQADLADPRFDRFMEFLDEEDFRPTANQLETYLAAAVGELGIRRERLTVGDGPGELGLVDLRLHLEGEGRLAAGATMTIVGADSVNSAVRRLAGADAGLVRQTHQSVARLKLEATNLPRRLGRVEQFKMAKLLGSVLDYRLNPNGYAEVDLFLAAEEHGQVSELGAVPAQPVSLDAATRGTLEAPFFLSIVDHLAANIGEPPGAIALQSTFRLEHQYSPQVTFVRPESTVFLVGDAAISLPFFRGMASLGANVHSLAVAHAAISAGGDVGAVSAEYSRAAREVAEREVGTVQARDRMVRAAREVVRVSAMVPFPIQSWLLSVDTEQEAGGRMTKGVMLNAMLAIIAAAIAVAAPLLGGYVSAPLGWLWLASLPVEALGGFAFAAVRQLEDQPNRWLSGVWQVQIALVLVAGIPLTVMSSRALGRPAQVYALVAWFFLGLAFVGGMYAFERRR